MRIRRHDAAVSYVCRALETRGYEVRVEPRIEIGAKVRKPDVISKLGTTAVVIDGQIINDQYDLDTAHRNKIKYYTNLEDTIMNMFNVQTVIFTSCTLSWRCVWSFKSAENLVEFGIIRKRNIKVLSSRAVIGGLAIYHAFMRSTAVRG